MATVNASRHHAPCPAPRPPEPDPALLDDTDLTEGRDAIERTFTATVVRQTIILDGYGLALRVSKGELEACDGIGTQRRTRRISRADAAAGRVRRVLVLGEGMVTTEAVSWCAALGVAVIITGASGEVLAMGAPELFSHGALVRAQALAAYTDTGIEITRWLLGMRLADQAWIAGPIAVCSNSHRTSVNLVLERLGILPLIDVVVSASEVGKNKPDPAVYLTTLQRLKVPCSGVVVFEDSDDGIAAAKGAGILNVVRCDFSNILLEVLKWV